MRLGSRFADMTASLGAEGHVFVKALERRMHYNGQNNVFTVRYTKYFLKGDSFPNYYF